MLLPENGRSGSTRYGVPFLHFFCSFSRPASERGPWPNEKGTAPGAVPHVLEPGIYYGDAVQTVPSSNSTLSTLHSASAST